MHEPSLTPSSTPSSSLDRHSLVWRLSGGLRWFIGDLCARVVHCASRIAAFRYLPRSIVIPFERGLIATRGEGLFDPDFYYLQNRDVSSIGADPFHHYLRHGWREGRAPNARFDDGHYRAQSGLHTAAPVSALAHYIALGQTGGLCPVPGIDLGALTQANPDLSVARLHPYRRMVDGSLDPDSPNQLDLREIRAGLAILGPRSTLPAEVDVIIPVYLGHPETLNSIWHVLKARNQTGVRLVVINDASPNDLMTTELQDLAERRQITLIEHQVNQGFVASINQGAALQLQRDVIWLNADTEVYDGWVDRLRAAAYSAPRIATVTPLTNNGTICSYPRSNNDNPGDLETSWPALDRMAGRLNRGLRTPTPTAVGFATYVRRDALIAVGGLDQEAFGRGYGEENDFSQRAIEAGWTNLIAADVVVRHFGATSFQGSRARRIERALRVLDHRFPNYRNDVQTFLANDPLFDARRALDWARLSCQSAGQNVLLITHSLGGGTQQHVHEETRRLTERGWSVFVLSGGTGGKRTASLGHASTGALPTLEALDIDGDDLWEMLRTLGITQAHIHHLIDFDTDMPDLLANRLKSADILFDFIVHDYFPICPRINLVDSHGYYCGEPDVPGCQRCLKRRGSRVGRPDIRDWRVRYEAFLTSANTIRVPDRDVANRLRRYFPDLGQIEIRPHEGPVVPALRSDTPRNPGPLRVAVLGAIGATKGFDVVLRLQNYVRSADLPMVLTVIGHTHNDAVARSAGVIVTGAYVNDEIDDLIQAVDPDLIWIPSIWPETYSYTLSIALRTGRPLAAFDIGAMGSRLRLAGRGALLPLPLARAPKSLYPALRRASIERARSGDAAA